MGKNKTMILKSAEKVLLMAILLFCDQNNLHAQTAARDDLSLYKTTISYQPKPVTAKSFILPAGLIATGALGVSGEFIISNPAIKEERDEHFQSFHTTIDNYLQFAPMVLGYAMLINNPQHSALKYTEKVLLTQVIMSGLVYSTKSITKVPRPDTGTPTSFPSGHTAQAFAGATLFCDEFAQYKPWLGVMVYSSAATVGILRVMNNRHWAGDVIAGAGFGMASAKLSEWIVEPHHKKNSINNNRF